MIASSIGRRRARSYGQSASVKATKGCRAAATPAATAAPFPRLRGNRTTRSGIGLVYDAAIAAVSSIDPSSTTTISLAATSRGNASAAWASVAGNRPASL
jgi:hypothetical protein